MPRPYGWASVSTVIQSPASRAARRRSCHARSASTAEQPIEEAEGEPALLERRLAEEAVGDGEPAGRAIAAGGLAEAALDGREQRPAHAVDGADAGRDALLAGQVLGIGEALEARSGAHPRTRRDRRSAPPGPAEGLGAGSPLGDEGDRAQRWSRSPDGRRAARSADGPPVAATTGVAASVMGPAPRAAKP